MYGLITENEYKGPSISFLYVNGIRYGNSAAKFWPELIEEAKQIKPSTQKIKVTGSCSEKLVKEQLFPEMALRKDVERLMKMNIGEVMRQAEAEIELFGSPCPLHVELIGPENTTLLQKQMPPECIDCDLFPFFLVWLLKWSEIPDSEWNNEYIQGAFTGEDKSNSNIYPITFSVNRKHLSEGLYSITCTLYFEEK